MRTREEIEAELAKVDKMLEQPVLNMYSQTSLEAFQQALCWALGQREDAPSSWED